MLRKGMTVCGFKVIAATKRHKTGSFHRSSVESPPTESRTIFFQGISSEERISGQGRGRVKWVLRALREIQWWSQHLPHSALHHSRVLFSHELSCENVVFDTTV